MTQENRRQFLKNTAGAAATLSLIGTSAKWAGANDRINVAVVGVHGRGRDHIQGHGNVDNVTIAALCDVDENILEQRKAGYPKIFKTPPKTYTDYRKLLDDKEIDVISIATPNHWHSLMGIWACQNDKDVYVEKPLSHNIYEGRKLVEAARKYNRIVQHGTQSRSSPALQEAMDHIKKGTIGDVYYAKGTCYKWRNTIGTKPVKPVPDGVNYDLWLGPAPQRPFTENRFHYNWHWHWDYGNGDIGNQGVHEMDIARWGLGVKGHPKYATSLGGHFMFDDDQETPNTLSASFKYPEENKLFVFEVRHWITNTEFPVFNPGENVVGNLFLGSEGMLVIRWYDHYEIYLGKNLEPGPKRSAGPKHYQNFIDCVRSRKQTDLNADVELGHYASALCHMANAAYRTQDIIEFDGEKEVCVNSKEADDILQGRDREYREPFVIPKNV